MLRKIRDGLVLLTLGLATVACAIPKEEEKIIEKPKVKTEIKEDKKEEPEIYFKTYKTKNDRERIVPFQTYDDFLKVCDGAEYIGLNAEEDSFAEEPSGIKMLDRNFDGVASSGECDLYLKGCGFYSRKNDDSSKELNSTIEDLERDIDAEEMNSKIDYKGIREKFLKMKE